MFRSLKKVKFGPHQTDVLDSEQWRGLCVGCPLRLGGASSRSLWHTWPWATCHQRMPVLASSHVSWHFCCRGLRTSSFMTFWKMFLFNTWNLSGCLVRNLSCGCLMLWKVFQPFCRSPNSEVGVNGKNKFCKSRCEIWLSAWAVPLGGGMLTPLHAKIQSIGLTYSELLAFSLVLRMGSGVDPSTPFCQFCLMNNNVDFWQVQGIRGVAKVLNCCKVGKCLQLPAAHLPSSSSSLRAAHSPHSLSLEQGDHNGPGIWLQHPSASLCSLWPPRRL